MTHKGLYGATKKRNVKGDISYFAVPPPSDKFKRCASQGDGGYNIAAYYGALALPGEALPFDVPATYAKKAEVVSVVALPVGSGTSGWRTAILGSKIVAIPYTIYGSDTYTQCNYSGDGGASWSAGTLANKQYVSICTDGAAFYTLATTGEIYKSTTGATWTYVSTVTIPDLLVNQTTADILFRAGLFCVFVAAYASNPTAVIASSPDCVTWSYASDTNVSKAYAVAINDAGVIAALVGRASYSTNGTTTWTNTAVTGTWTMQTIFDNVYFPRSDFETPLKSVKNRFYVMTSTGSVFISDDNFRSVKNYNNFPFSNTYAPVLMTASSKYVVTGTVNGGTINTVAIWDVDEHVQLATVDLFPLTAAYDILVAMSSSAVTIDEATFGFFTQAIGTCYFKKLTINKTKSYATYAAVTYVDSPAPYSYLSQIAAPYVAIDDNVNPADYPGYISCGYNPGYGTSSESKFKRIDGSSTYTNAAASLRATFPKLNVTLCGAIPRVGVSGINDLYPMGARYIGSTIVLVMMGVNEGHRTDFITSTDEGATWSVTRSIAGDQVALADLGQVTTNCLAHDGSTYFLSAANSLGYGCVYTMSTLTGTLTLTSLNSTNHPVIQSYTVECVSSSSTVAIGNEGSIFQSTDHGASWTLITTLTGVVSISKITKIGSYYYVLCQYGVFKSSDLLSYTAISGLSSASVSSLVYHSPTNTWLTYDVYQYTGYVSTDNMATFTTYRGGLPVYPQAVLGNYIIDTSGKYAVSPNGPTYDMNMAMTDPFKMPIQSEFLVLSEILVLTIGSGNQLITWRNTGSWIGLYYVPYVLSFDTTTMQMPAINEQSDGIGCWMRIAD